MKWVILDLLVVSLLAYILSSSTFAADVAIVSCDVISEDVPSKIHAGRSEFQIILVSFSVSNDGILTVKKNTGRSCVEVLASLVNKENFKIEGVSSIDNGPAYTLLRRE